MPYGFNRAATQGFFFNDDDLTFFFLAQKIRHCHEVVFWAWLLSNTACSTLKDYWVLTNMIFSLFSIIFRFAWNMSNLVRLSK
jgi:hypothetical protein